MGASPLPEGTNVLENVTRLRSLDANIVGAINAAGGMVLPVKTTAGDPADPAEGQIYVNLSESKVRCYADGLWRDLAVW